MLYLGWNCSHQKNEHLKALKTCHMNLLHDAFPEFEFFKDDGSELFLVNPHTDLKY